jgi:hypothetical protein
MAACAHRWSGVAVASPVQALLGHSELDLRPWLAVGNLGADPQALEDDQPHRAPIDEVPPCRPFVGAGQLLERGLIDEIRDRGHRLQVAAARLLELDRLEQGLEIAHAEAT